VIWLLLVCAPLTGIFYARSSHPFGQFARYWQKANVC